MKALAEFIYLFFMSCNFIGAIGIIIKIATQKLSMGTQWALAVFAILASMAFLSMLKTYIVDLTFNSKPIK